MPKKKAARRSAGLAEKSSAKQVNRSVASATPVDYLPEAARQRDMMEFGAAISLYQRALEANPDNLVAIDALGELLLEVGDVDSAVEMFHRSIRQAPDSNASKYMYLGQVNEGAAAVECFERGIGILEREMKSLETGPDASVANSETDEQLIGFRRGLCSGHCAIAEVLLPDADESEPIYARCQAALEQARQVNSSLYLLAELELSPDVACSARCASGTHRAPNLTKGWQIFCSVEGKLNQLISL